MDPKRTVRLVARLYAVLSVLGGLFVFVIVAVLIAAFGSRGVFEPQFLSFVMITGVVPIVLTPFIWRGQPWAMFTVLAIALGLTFLFSRQSPMLQVLLPATTALFALFTGVRMWLGAR